MRSIFTIITILFISISSYSQETETKLLTNKGVIELHKSGLSKMIITKMIIEAQKFDFDTSVDGLKFLSENEVPDELIMKLIDKQSSKNQNSITVNGITFENQGLYYFDENKKTEIIAHSSTGSGIKGKKIIIGVNDKSSNIVVKSDKPVFYFIFDNGQSKNEVATISAFSTIKSPNEGLLVKFHIKKGNRKIQIGKIGMSGFEVLIDKKNRVGFKAEKIKENIYKITVVENLEPGEYAFVFGQLNLGTARFYDFTVE